MFGHGRDLLDEGRHGFHFTEPIGHADRIDLAGDDRQVFRCKEMAGLDGMEGGGTRDARIEGHEHAIVPAGAHSGSPRVTTISNVSLVMNRAATHRDGRNSAAINRLADERQRAEAGFDLGTENAARTFKSGHGFKLL